MGRRLTVIQPLIRADCIDGPRPCPWAACRYSLVVKLTETGKAVRRTTGPSCALDVADSGAHSTTEVATAMGLSHPRVSQLEAAGIRKIEKLWPAFKLVLLGRTA